MTIIVGITTPDGVILASESRTTHNSAGGHHRILSDSAQKVFEIGSFGVATTGEAFIAGKHNRWPNGPNSLRSSKRPIHETLTGSQVRSGGSSMTALSGGSRKCATPKRSRKATTRTKGATTKRARKTKSPSPYGSAALLGFPLRFLVTGYDAERIGHIHEVLIPGPERGDVSATTANSGTVWCGQTDVITRMLKGVDRARLLLPMEQLSDDALEAIDEGFNAVEYMHLFPITLQDAIDYSSFLIRTTINMQRFSDGTMAAPGEVPGCGGPLQILVVERSGRRWATKPELRVT